MIINAKYGIVNNRGLRRGKILGTAHGFDHDGIRCQMVAYPWSTQILKRSLVLTRVPMRVLLLMEHFEPQMFGTRTFSATNSWRVSCFFSFLFALSVALSVSFLVQQTLQVATFFSPSLSLTLSHPSCNPATVNPISIFLHFGCHHILEFVFVNCKLSFFSIGYALFTLFSVSILDHDYYFCTLL